MPSRQEREDELRARNNGLPLIGGSANPGGMLPTSTTGEAPTPIVHVKSKNPIGGPQLVQSTASALVQLGYYTTPYNVPRKVTVFVTVNAPITAPPSTSPVSDVGLYIKLTWGPERGMVSQWIAAPCAFPIEGEFVKVEATIGRTPFRLNSASGLAIGGPGGLGTPPTLFGSTTLLETYATALIIDGWTDDGPSIGLTGAPEACGGVTAGSFMVQGPVLIEEILLTNTNASGTVLMGIFDADNIASRFQVAETYVDAGTTVSIGKDLLGAFASGVNIAGIVPPPSGVNVNDTTDVNVYAQIRGRYLLPGNL